MGIRVAGGSELAPTVATGNFVALGNGTPIEILGDFNFALWGVFVGTVVLECSYDGGTTWLASLFKFTLTAIQLVSVAATSSSESEPGVLYRVRCSAFTSGTINWRISSGANRDVAANQHFTG